jgi:hypothetical protein
MSVRPILFSICGLPCQSRNAYTCSPGDVHNLWDKTKEVQAGRLKDGLAERGLLARAILLYKAMLDCQVQRLRDLAIPQSESSTCRKRGKKVAGARWHEYGDNLTIVMKAKANL